MQCSFGLAHFAHITYTLSHLPILSTCGDDKYDYLPLTADVCLVCQHVASLGTCKASTWLAQHSHGHVKKSSQVAAAHIRVPRGHLLRLANSTPQKSLQTEPNSASTLHKTAR